MIGDRIREIRKLRGLSQGSFSSLLGLSQTFVSNIEKNKQTPSYDALLKIHDVLGISLDYLVYGVEAQSNLTEDELAILKAVRDDQSLGAKVKRWALEKKRLEYDFEHALVA